MEIKMTKNVLTCVSIAYLEVIHLRVKRKAVKPSYLKYS